MQNSTVTTTGTTTLTGMALGTTTAVWNSGVYVFLNSTVTGGGGTITGNGGGGTGFNHGIYITLGSTTTLGTSGTAGSGATSEDEAGSFFP